MSEKILLKISSLKTEWGIEDNFYSQKFQEHFCNYNDHPCDCDNCFELREISTRFFFSAYKNEWNFLKKLNYFHICKGKTLISLKNGKRYYVYAFYITNSLRSLFTPL